MKIGIMTFWWSENNYGQLLQCYALQKYLQDAGHDAYLIRYDPRNDYVKSSIWENILKACNLVRLCNFLLYKKRMFADMREKRDNPRRFGDFCNKHIKLSEKIYYSYQELKENPPEAEVYIAGSDQIWNPDFLSIKKTNAQVRAYFLDFGNSSIKRIAYAASFGKTVLDTNFVKEITPLLQRFNYISVREKSGLDICKQCSIDNAEWVFDPTMLLNKDAYNVLYKDELLKKPDKSYCFLYLLGNECDFSFQTIYDWAAEKAIEVIYVAGNGLHDKYKKTYTTIPEWIYLLKHAEYVITNSYHCSVFSLLFQKQFGVIPLTGRDSGMNSRFESLFALFKIKNRFIHEDFSVMDEDVDWQTVSAIFQNICSSCKLLEVI